MSISIQTKGHKKLTIFKISLSIRTIADSGNHTQFTQWTRPEITIYEWERTALKGLEYLKICNQTCAEAFPILSYPI